MQSVIKQCKKCLNSKTIVYHYFYNYSFLSNKLKRFILNNETPLIPPKQPIKNNLSQTFHQKRSISKILSKMIYLKRSIKNDLSQRLYQKRFNSNNPSWLPLSISLSFASKFLSWRCIQNSASELDGCWLCRE